jgi:eukaryotic-like serine/threonine-protein kinase
MPLEPGSRVGPFEILSPLGRGGMGEVFRARDTRLRREVAIKALPDALARDPERRARFEREARLLGALNHANIATLYGVEEAEGAVYLVLELIEGEGLDQKLAGGALPSGEALGVASQIAAGLEAAHGVGIIHRDLKPSNVKVRPDGTVKVLDFGLARMADDPAAADTTGAPTITSGGTGTGIVLGTAAYMSPEQARGKPLDKRTDVFSFGCLVYECLTGQRAFRGETVSDTMAAVLTAEPDWSMLGETVPPRLAALIRRCLQKDLARRLRDMGDARLEIEEIRADGSGAEAPAVLRGGGGSPARFRAPLLYGLAGLLGGALLVFAGVRLAGRGGARAAGSPVSAILPLPEGTRINLGGSPLIAISPDGTTVVFRSAGGGVGRLYRRALSGGEAQLIPGTERGFAPFFSPDGQWLGFLTLSELKKVPMSGGEPILVAELSPVSRGAAWMEDGSVVVARTNNNGLFRVSSVGGSLERFIPLDASRGEHALLWPQELPGSRGILVTVVRGEDFQDMAKAEVAVIEPATGKRHVLIERSTFARFVPPGWLVFVRGGAVLVVRLDVSGLRIEGTPVAVREPIARGGSAGTASFGVTTDGTLVFVEGDPPPEFVSSVVLLDRSGRETALPLAPAGYQFPAFSSDGRRIVLQKCVGLSCKLHVFDRERGVLSPLATEPGRFLSPVWSPDGRDVAFSYLMLDDPRAAARSADGTGAIRTLTPEGENAEFPNAISADGRTLLYSVSYDTDRGGTRRRGTSDLWIVPLDGSSAPHPWFESPARESAGALSPDGRWAAYVSDETGRSEVYVRSFPDAGSKLKISQEGGIEPVWTRGGREIVFRERQRFLAADFRPGPTPSAAAPRFLFTARVDSGSGRIDTWRTYDAARSGEEFVAIRPENVVSSENRLAVVTRWTATLEQTFRK